MNEPLISLKPTTVKRSNGILTLLTPLGVAVGEALKGKIVSMVYLVVSIIKLNSETWCTIVNDYASDRIMLYGSGIGHDFHEI